MTRRSYTGAATPTTITAPIGSSDTTLTLADVAGLPSSTFVITIDQGLVGEEKILVGTRTSTSCSSLTRGFDGTIAAAHAFGAAVLHTISAVDLDEANAHVNATTGVHGTSGTIVDTASTQTLANKTLASPIINSPVLGSPLTQAQTHASPDTDGSTSSLHHTIGTGATQAAAGNHAHSPTTLYVSMSPPLFDRQVTTNSSGTGTVVDQLTSVGLNTGTTAGSYQQMYRQAGHSLGPLVTLKGTYLDVSLKYTIFSSPGAGLFAFYITDQLNVNFSSAVTAPNGLTIEHDLSAGTFQVRKWVSSVGTVQTLTGAPTITSTSTTGSAIDLRFQYPVAGGAGSVYINGVLVCAVTGLTAIASNWPFFNCQVNNKTTAANRQIDVHQIVITES